jgi:hypothetical protein
LGQRLGSQGLFKRSREVSYKSRTAIQYVAETTVILHRPAWRHRKRNGKTINERMPGEPITLRLIVSRVCNAAAQTLAVWYLLTNTPAEIGTATVALWYYWRWRIESLRKLHKSAGQQAEQWQQETGGKKKVSGTEWHLNFRNRFLGLGLLIKANSARPRDGRLCIPKTSGFSRATQGAAKLPMLPKNHILLSIKRLRKFKCHSPLTPFFLPQVSLPDGSY